MNHSQWKTWGIQYELEPEYSRAGQLSYYTNNPDAAKDAESKGADVSELIPGEFAIYTRTER